MTKDEALRLAWDALQQIAHVSAMDYEYQQWAVEAITAIKEALAQPEQEPVAWKIVPIKPTHEMLKAMDECSTEGYDERLYAGHAASVYMAAVDVAPTPPQRKPLTDEEIILIVADCASSHQHTDIHFARAIEAAHGIKGLI